MNTIQIVMLVALGFLAASLCALMLAPLYRRRVVRLTTEYIKRTLPLTESEIRADRDRLRAEFAIHIHKLEVKVDDAAHTGAHQMIEINRRDASITALESEVVQQHTTLEEHENARRVLEQTILDRLPKVEQRLAEARKLLVQRDRELADRARSEEQQARMLEAARQAKLQQTDEIHRLNATLNARQVRSRETYETPGYEDEIALRSEIESLREQNRQQAQAIRALQQDNGGAGLETSAAVSNSDGIASDFERLRGELEAAQADGKAARDALDARAKAEARSVEELRALKASNQDQAAEIARLSAALKAYEEGVKGERGVKESKIALKARVGALEALTDEQAAMIQALRSEVAAGNERLARQGAAYMEEMRRLGTASPLRSRTTGPAGIARRPLFERLVENTPARATGTNGAETGADDGYRVETSPGHGEGAPAPATGAVETRNAGQPAARPAAAIDAPAGSEMRRPRLLDRITGLDKRG